MRPVVLRVLVMEIGKWDLKGFGDANVDLPLFHGRLMIRWGGNIATGLEIGVDNGVYTNTSGVACC